MKYLISIGEGSMYYLAEGKTRKKKALIFYWKQKLKNIDFTIRFKDGSVFRKYPNIPGYDKGILFTRKQAKKQSGLDGRYIFRRLFNRNKDEIVLEQKLALDQV